MILRVFDHPNAPFIPIVYTFNGERFVRETLPSDGKSRRYLSEVRERFVAFRDAMQADCEDGCADWKRLDIAKASREIDNLDEALR